VADASNVVLADRYRTRTILTLDRRAFEVLRPITGGRFAVLPDARQSRGIAKTCGSVCYATC